MGRAEPLCRAFGDLCRRNCCKRAAYGCSVVRCGAFQWHSRIDNILHGFHRGGEIEVESILSPGMFFLSALNFIQLDSEELLYLPGISEYPVNLLLIEGTVLLHRPCCAQ